MPRAAARGFSLVEIAVVVVLAMILLAFSVPMIQSTVSKYRQRSAVATATWAIQTTRYQAIMRGYPYAITFDSTTATYQVSSQPPGATGFSSDGPAIPLGAAGVSITPTTTLQFRPNGMVQATTGQLNFSISYKARTSQITVSSYGNVSYATTDE